MRKCKLCGWYFEPKNPHQLLCDEECRKESMRIARRDYNRRIRKKSKPPKAVLKCNPSKLPKPPFPPTKEVRIDDVEPIDQMFAREETVSMVSGAFTPDEDRLIAAMIEDGMTITYIAKELHRYPGAVAGHAKSLGLRGA